MRRLAVWDLRMSKESVSQVSLPAFPRELAFGLRQVGKGDIRFFKTL